VLGLFQLDEWDYAAGPVPAECTLSGEEIDAKVAERNEARRQKNFQKADEIRKFLAAQGIIIEDKPDGTSRWKR
jgi:cysteinyl-tRNA synthetase